MKVLADDQLHPPWCARGPRCTSGIRAGEIPEHQSASRIVAADVAAGGDGEYRVTLTQVKGDPVMVELEAGLPDAFDETAEQHSLSLAQARRLAAVLTELAAEGGEGR